VTVDQTPAPSPETPPPSVPDARRTHGRAVAVLFAAVAVIGLAVGIGVHYSSVNGTAIDTNQVPESGPLNAYYGTVDGQRTAMCDPTSAQAWTDGNRTVSVDVSLPDKGTVQVWITEDDAHDFMPLHLTQQVPPRSDTAHFTTWIANPGAPVKVTARVRNVSGTCTVLPQRR
jgi:hypothetical protein